MWKSPLILSMLLLGSVLVVFPQDVTATKANCDGSTVDDVFDAKTAKAARSFVGELQANVRAGQNSSRNTVALKSSALIPAFTRV